MQLIENRLNTGEKSDVPFVFSTVITLIRILERKTIYVNTIFPFSAFAP